MSSVFALYLAAVAGPALVARLQELPPVQAAVLLANLRLLPQYQRDLDQCRQRLAEVEARRARGENPPIDHLIAREQYLKSAVARLREGHTLPIPRFLGPADLAWIAGGKPGRLTADGVRSTRERIEAMAAEDPYYQEIIPFLKEEEARLRRQEAEQAPLAPPAKK